jgi:hypothetical protein
MGSGLDGEQLKICTQCSIALQQLNRAAQATGHSPELSPWVGVEVAIRCAMIEPKVHP